MIEILPELKISFSCISCKSDSIEIHRVIFQGIHVVADCKCQSCGIEFYSTLPTAHNKHSEIQFTKDGLKTNYDFVKAKWRAIPLINSVLKYPKQPAKFHCEQVFKAEDVILVNCIDDCFGHVFTRLWNVQSLIKNHPNKGIVVLLPLQCKWLVPESVAEIWTVDLNLRLMDKFIEGLDDFVNQQLKRFRTVMLSDAYVHLDHSKYLDVQSLVKTSPFDLKTFATKQITITFVLREDRFWHNSRLLDFVFKVCVKYKIFKYAKGRFIRRQNSLVNQVIHLFLKQFPDAKVYITGIGSNHKSTSVFTDLRVSEIKPDTETLWNKTYAESHIVIGVHGSNMLIPSGLAAGMINILPRYKIDHITEDVIQPYTNRYLQFLGRYVDEYSSPSLIAMHAISMIKSFLSLYNNTEQVPE